MCVLKRLQDCYCICAGLCWLLCLISVCNGSQLLPPSPHSRSVLQGAAASAHAAQGVCAQSCLIHCCTCLHGVSSAWCLVTMLLISAGCAAVFLRGVLLCCMHGGPAHNKQVCCGLLCRIGACKCPKARCNPCTVRVLAIRAPTYLMCCVSSWSDAVLLILGVVFQATLATGVTCCNASTACELRCYNKCCSSCISGQCVLACCGKLGCRQCLYAAMLPWPVYPHVLPLCTALLLARFLCGLAASWCNSMA
jgi:hypothetical protein